MVLRGRMSENATHLPPPQAADLLRWYDAAKRRFAWRDTGNPYLVWLSEIMLQQTNTATVAPYFDRFRARFPDVHALAAAEPEAVKRAWAGLGYYARARNLHECARAVSGAGGEFPRTVDALQALPGIGPYTARAIAAIAFGVPGVPVDGNVARIAARLFLIETPLPAAKPALAAAAARLGEDAAAQARPGDFAQALFDLGATICTRRPGCGICPLMASCAGRAAGIAADLPRRSEKPARPLRYGAQFWLIDAQGRVLLRQRPESGLLGGMTELPGSEWRAAPWPESEALEAAPMRATWRRAGSVRHVFTHFELRLDIFSARVARICAPGFLRDAGALADEALPSVMRKCARVGAAA